MNNVKLSDLHLTHKSRRDVQNAVKQQLHEVTKDEGVLLFLLQNLVQDRKTKKYFWRANIPGICQEIAEVGNFPDFNNTFDGSSLFIGGANSEYITLRDYGKIKQLFPNSVIERVPNAGHWVHAEQPVVFQDMVCDFLNEKPSF